MPLDFGLLDQGPRINTPFEHLSQILQVRQQQESARGLAEQRQAIAEQRRAQTDALQRDAEREARLTALFSTNPKPTRADIMKADPSENGQKIATAIDALQDADLKRYKDQRAVTKEAIAGLNALPENMRPNGYGAIRQTFLARGWATPEDIPEAYDPKYVAGIQQSLLSPEKQYDIDNPKPPADYNLGNSRMSGATNQPLATAAPDAPKLGSLEDFIVSYATTRRLKPEQLSAGDKLKAKAIYEAAGRAPASSGDGAKFWVVRDGNQIRISDAQYRPGDLPASTREQGRRLTSGDAGRMADIDEALKLAGNLDFKQGDTGIMPYLGGKAPDAVTNLTGFGLEAKKRQGVINLVKQIIGKGLEGGVLRKEDEIKYEKMLPTLSDPAEVVQSKIVNMKRTMEQKRSTFLDNLADAGYDTAKQEARGAASGSVTPPQASSGGTSHKVGDTVIGPDGKPHKVLEVSPDGKRYRLDGGG